MTRVLLMVENVPFGVDIRLRKHAAALIEAGCSVTVITRRDPSNQRVSGVRLFEYRAPKDASNAVGFVREYLYSIVMAAILTIRAFFSGGFDVMQISSTPDIYFLIAFPFRLLGKKVVFDWKDPSPELYEARYHRKSGLMYSMLRRFERASFRVAHHVFVINETLREVANERGNVELDRMTIIGNGPRMERLYPRTPDPELRRGYRHLVCLVGMMGPQDKIDLAIRAVDHLVHRIGRTDTAFTFVGVGDAVPGLMALTKELAVGEWVTFPGWAEENLAFTYMSTADLGIEPNLEHFVSPVKAMEYMALGLPFVAFDVAETKLLAGCAAAYAPREDFVAFAHVLDELLDDPVRRKEMGELGKERVRSSLAWDHQKHTYTKVICSLASS